MEETAIQQPNNDPFMKSVRRNGHKVVTFFGVPANTILVFFAIFLLLLDIYPVYSLFIKSVTETTIFASDIGAFTGKWYATVFNWHNSTSVGNFWRPLGHSLLVSVLSCIFALFFGGVTAFLLARTNMKLKEFISAVFIFPYIMPQWTLAMFWSNLFVSDKIPGGHVGEFQALFHVACPQWFVYGPFSISLILGLHYAPFAYILLGGVLQNMDSNLEEAATILGIPKWKSFVKVTIPMLKPSILSTILLVFSSAMSSYTVASTLGNPVNYYVLASQMQTLIQGAGGRNAGQGYVMALVMILMGLVLLAMNQAQTASRKQFTTVTGKSGQSSLLNLGKVGKWIAAFLVSIIVLFFCVGPMVSFFLESLLPNPGDYSSGFSFRAWVSEEPLSTNDFVGFFHERKIWKSILGTIKISIICAITAGLSGFLIGYAVSKKRKSKFANFVNGLAFLPYLMPSIAMSVTFFLMAGGLKISNWVLIAVLLGTIKYIPMASRSSLNAMMQISGEIEEAAIIQHVPWWKRILFIIFPIQKSAIISGFLLPFISCMREYDLFLFIGNDQLTLTKFMFQLEADGVPALENAANFFLVVVILLVNWLTNLLTGAGIDKGVGGSKNA